MEKSEIERTEKVSEGVTLKDVIWDKDLFWLATFLGKKVQYLSMSRAQFLWQDIELVEAGRE